MVEEKVEITLDALKQGSDAVLKRVYEENRSKFLNFAKRYHLSHEENVDIYQDAYIVFYNNVMNGKIESFTSSIATYLFSIGKYLIFNRMRKNKKTLNLDVDLTLVQDEDIVQEDLQLEKADLTPEQKLLQDHFSTLGERCQALLTLFYYRGFTIEEIMLQENYNSKNVVKAAKSRCMKTLRERIHNTNLR